MTNGAVNYTRKEIKAMAKSMLARKGVLLKLICAIFICVMLRISAEFAMFAVYMLFYTLFPELEVLLTFTVPPAVRLLYTFLMAPAVLGTYRLASLLAKGEDAPLTEMFYYFKPRAYLRSLGAYSVAVLPIEVYFLIASLLVDGAYYLCLFMDYGDGYFLAMNIGIVALFVVLAVPLLLAYGKLFSVLAATVNGEGQPLSVCIRAAMKATKGKGGAIFALRFSFAPFILISLATIGMMLVAFTVPYMLLTYFYYNAVLFGQDPRPQIIEEVAFDER